MLKKGFLKLFFWGIYKIVMLTIYYRNLTDKYEKLNRPFILTYLGLSSIHLHINVYRPVGTHLFVCMRQIKLKRELSGNVLFSQVRIVYFIFLSFLPTFINVKRIYWNHTKFYLLILLQITRIRHFKTSFLYVVVCSSVYPTIYKTKSDKRIFMKL